VNVAPNNDPAFVADPTVVVDGVTKWFGQKVAVSELSCSFGPGITGLLGPNGAGKTTLLRMLTGLIRPSEGSISLLGEQPRLKPQVYRGVGLVPEENSTYPNMTARSYLAYAAQLNDLEDPKAAVDRVLETVQLTDVADRKLGGFSKGMRQRTKVAAALVHDPRVLVLDEPLNGTDPVQRVRLIDLFRRLGSDGRTVIVSSHILEEVERVSDRVIAIVDGRLAAAGDVGAIRRAMADIPYRVRVDVDRGRDLAAALLTDSIVHGVQVTDRGLVVETEDVTQLGVDLLPLAKDVDARVTMFRPEDASLESVFRYLVDSR